MGGQMFALGATAGLHTAMLVGAARLLSGADFAGGVVLMFQPGEEGHSGARHLGTCPPGRDPRAAPNNHAPNAVFDDAVLTDGAALLAELALRRVATPI
jgi:metal-dependent amidase/aminoacylase/carboxypeptidase family protein